MSGLKTKRLIWTVIFLGITLGAIGMEVIAGVFHPAGTIPWTEYIAQYVPWPFQLAAYVTLAVWLPFHFWRHDHLVKAAYRKGRSDGHLEAVTHRLTAYSELVPRNATAETDRNARAYGWEVGKGAPLGVSVPLSEGNPFVAPEIPPTTVLRGGIRFRPGRSDGS